MSNLGFQCCHRQHLNIVLNTRKVEAMGAALMASPAPLTIAAVRDFTVAVTGWGGKTGARVLWRIARAPDPLVLAAFTDATVHLTARNVRDALRAIQLIPGLGRFSYSSKHLRMLAPELCGVLDGIIDAHLNTIPGYARLRPEDRLLGYGDYCQMKARELTRARVKLGDFIQSCQDSVQLVSDQKKCQWSAGDVDMAGFAWLNGWCATGADKYGCHEGPTSPKQLRRTTKLQASQGSRNKKDVIYLCQNHDRDTAVTIKQSCDSNWNNAWICRDHGSLDFKVAGARGTTRHLIDEILRQGVDVTRDPRWMAARRGKTCHHDGVNFQGGLRRMGSVAKTVRYLKRFFTIIACPGNQTETQRWVDAL